MQLLHYANKPFVLDRAITYHQEGKFKPTGLWVSIPGEKDWPSWCRGEDFCIEGLTYVTEIILCPQANILEITSITQLYQFDRLFHLTNDQHNIRNIDWSQVKAHYSGIVISPYQYLARLDLTWYYGWDCASGCIWNMSIIEDAIPTQMTKAASPYASAQPIRPGAGLAFDCAYTLL